MKKLMNLGKALNKNEQKEINGGYPDYLCRYVNCPPDKPYCHNGVCSSNGAFNDGWS